MSKKLIISIVIFLALVAAIYAPQKSIKIYSYERLTSPYNTDWGGTSNLVEYLKEYYALKERVQVNVIIIDNISILEGYPHRSYFSKYLHDILVIIGPDYPYSEEEIKIIRNFLMNGGSLLIADELGIVNDLINNLFKVSISPEKIDYYLALVSQGIEVKWYAHFYPFIDKDVEIDLPGYINQTDYLLIGGYYDEYVQGDLSGTYVVACYGNLGVSRVYIVADTSIFINKYIDRSENRKVIIDIIDWLSGIREFEGKGGLVRIYIDASHHKPISLSLPLPHIGRIIAGYIESYGSQLNVFFQRYVVNAPLLTKIIVMVFVLIGIYGTIRKWYREKAIKDNVMSEVVEENVLLYSPEYERMKVRIKRRGGYKEVVAKLYELLNLMLFKRLGITIEDLIISDRGWDKISLYLNLKEYELKRFKAVFKDLYEVKEYIEGKRRILPIIFWRRKVNWYISKLSPLFKRLGLELGGE